MRPAGLLLSAASSPKEFPRNLARSSLKVHGPWLGPEVEWAEERVAARWRFWANEDTAQKPAPLDTVIPRERSRSIGARERTTTE